MPNSIDASSDACSPGCRTLYPDLDEATSEADERAAIGLSSKNLEKATEAGVDEIRDKFATPGEFVGAIRRLGTGE